MVLQFARLYGPTAAGRPLLVARSRRPGAGAASIGTVHGVLRLRLRDHRAGRPGASQSGRSWRRQAASETSSPMSSSGSPSCSITWSPGLWLSGNQAAGALLEISTLRPIPGSLTLRDSALFSAILARGAAGSVLGVH